MVARILRDAITIGSLVRYPVHLLDFEQVQADLTIRNGAYWAAKAKGLATSNMPSHLHLWQREGDHVLVPRYYVAPIEDPSHKAVVLDKRTVGQREHPVPRHVIKLRDETQQQAAQALIDGEHDRLLCLACGKGKTVVSLFAAGEASKLPVLVVVPTSELLRQWQGEIQKFYPGAKVGHVQQSIEEWKGCDFVVGMLHTLIRRTYSQEFYDYFRLVIFDEAHRLGAFDFSKAAGLFPCERWGLTATPNRSDGMEIILQLHLGEIAYRDTEQDLKPTVYFIRTNITPDAKKFTFKRRMRINGRWITKVDPARLNWAQLTTWLCNHEHRNKMALNLIDKATRKGRVVLILGERIDQLQWLYENSLCPSKSLLVGSMGSDERARALTKQVVFATQHLAKEGLNRPEFDTLFILNLFGDPNRIEQSTGRILRAHDGKKEPLAFVFVDDFKPLTKLATKMIRVFEKLKYTVKWYRDETKNSGNNRAQNSTEDG